MNLPKSVHKLPVIEKPEQITAYKITDAPDLADNFYYNLIDMSKSDYLSIGIL